ncbi:lasso peptide biosynthesis PqqD family chaperone [Alteribacter natronophilus]|uniref:lasso peptide biosynthesis PqqD family chaperone n=1 Tax=Alteribacter natronophilus TaxID=2583810 RepID=UPI00110E6961|nr:lasso peptide biosynthesis PqqD family chaperone [Alteribacter natronophilus]TMW70531.1 lasso peptide biosynthesis PqqD family chaperone [Alteribacter natronophilus]
MMIAKQTISLDHQVTQKPGNIASDMDGDKVMLSVENGKYYNLGETGGAIWELIEKPAAVRDVVTSLCNEYDVSEEECVKQVTAFLTQLDEENLIDVK